MRMDPRVFGFSGSSSEIRLRNQSLPILQNQRFENGFFDQSREFGYLQSNLMIPANTPSSSVLTHEEPSPEDCEFSDSVLSYISQILMEEDMEDKTCMLQDSLDLQIAEKSFYEVIGEKYPFSAIGDQSSVDPNNGGGYDSLPENCGACPCNDGDLSSIFTNNSLRRNLGEVPNQNLQGNSISQSSYSSSNSVISSVEGPVESPHSILQVPDVNSESQSILQFQKGVEEASKFLPSGNGLFANLDTANFSTLEPEMRTDELSIKVEKDEGESLLVGSKGRKHHHREEGDVEENRSSKQAAIYSEPTLRSNMIDIILLHSVGDGKRHFMARREALQNKNDKIVVSNGKSKASGGGKGRGKKQNGKREVVDLRTLLVLCAQAVAADDYKSAHELLKQIRHHSDTYGDGNQRLASIFADGLEARLAGTGSQIYKGLVSKRTSAADFLKAYYLYLAACPFRKMTSFISNVTIKSCAENSMRIHVIDFGILYGFQWPTFIQRLSLRSEGPPKLRITGIDFPQPGFRPAERIIETGRRLAAYAESFKVPFEYNGIAKKWETIQLEELKIDRDEYLVVTCFHRGKNVLDESVVVDSPRNKFLSLIRKINPDIFIHGITNGGFNAPFFVTRFREALFHYSSLFDMLETIVPREDWERRLIEKEIFGREALNVIACEGCERVERPETYRQWQVRILRAGFLQQPFDHEIVKRAIEKVRSSYHKDFVIDEDSQWLLQGWKGRIVYAISCWKPA
ncbi:scarecrow-like protein 9 [Abrus precatorius]|uniref:Scarecrow-like protein 9 n=1 Tax=Abrus precatorius TaxID=3816 RepID=A0A8B8L1T9_ABRPR|nr:scarecrow-like protein 9 [Abrus precatorius]XP_027350230.1 scarecrow-like protein 9 [Abrus precatorius]XP_027350231.1 scarecrow-like protein 9 [Abrus precatorius]XP_027350232.1 scarecrow-like protein 9 [Abrus precatorius]XP_027350233.1 scarecrow-like protein 9 [Abrus precatorius]XP_027350234.1 scarecrow-like protein 9 [Abrus precatorius]